MRLPRHEVCAWLRPCTLPTTLHRVCAQGTHTVLMSAHGAHKVKCVQCVQNLKLLPVQVRWVGAGVSAAGEYQHIGHLTCVAISTLVSGTGSVTPGPDPSESFETDGQRLYGLKREVHLDTVKFTDTHL